ncbi:uncharacterized protein LOC134278229 [Saccostrea cucullata]|uniref:uncharacterized protein LOC134278229 n=1 Tax=Saccostrea cuccullata TaxID=36930 RepID=UPI002ED0D779
MCHKGRVSLDTKCTLQDLGTTRGKPNCARKQTNCMEILIVFLGDIPANLIKITSKSQRPIAPCARPVFLYTLNCRSARNKTSSICDLIISNDIDLLAITETWLGDSDQCVISELLPDGYKFIHKARSNGRSGGVALVYKSIMDVKAVSREDTFTHFEYLECIINFTRLCIIYRPPPSKKNQLRNSVFFYEWSHFLDSVVVDHRELIITGDLNFHLDNVQDPEGVKFLRILDDHGLVQHVKESTHSGGHILDVVIVRDSSSILYGEPCVTDPGLYDKNGNPAGDHLAICSKLTLSKPARERKSIKFRKLRDIVTSDLSDSIRSSFELQKGENSVEKSVNLYNTTLKNILDSLAPVQSKLITIRPDCPWYTSELRDAKRERRKAERQMRRTDLTVHKEIFRSHCTQVSKLAIHCKRSYYSSKIVEMGKDQKQLYHLTNRLMGAKSDVILLATVSLTGRSS